MNKMFRVVSTVMWILCFAGAAQADPIIINGSFEEPELGTGWSTFSTIPGWQATGAYAIEIGYAPIYGVTGYDGDQVLELDSYGNALVTQVVTTPGTYTLTFIYARRGTGGTPDASNTFDVYWNGDLVKSLAPTSTVMSLYSATVVALGNDTLTFRGTGIQDSYGAIIDNVQLNSVPDGAFTFSLLGMGLLGLGWLRRKL